MAKKSVSKKSDKAGKAAPAAPVKMTKSGAKNLAQGFKKGK